jgi:hypothetical protein
MAPEQWSGEPVAATDQYALAVLAYELLAGHPSFTGRQEQVMYQHFNVQPQPPSAFNPLLSKAIDTVILTALAKKAADRFISISAFARALQQAVQGSDTSTLVKTPSTPKSADLHATLNPGLVLPSAIPPESRRLAAVANPFSPTLNVSPSPQATSRRQRPFNRGLFAILLIGLALLVTGASFGFFYLQGNNHTAQAPTSTNVIATTQANDATAFAATAAAHTNTFPPPGANLVLNDPLSNNDHGYNWETKPDAGGFCQFAGGAYQVDERQSVTEYCPAYSTSFGSPFAYEVQMAITQGDLGGLIVRDDMHSISYYFRFRQNGDYDVVYYDNHSSQAHGPLVASNASIFSPGYNQSNLIAVVVRGNRIDLYVNNQYINSVSIGVYGSGYIGVFVTDKGNPTEAIFSHAKVWTL